MSKRSRCDAFGSFYLDFPRDEDDLLILQRIKDLMALEDELREFFVARGFTVRALKFDVKDGRYKE